MNAQPLLKRIMRTLREAKLEAVLIGNSAAALLGAPVTTLDFDFFFRRTSLNINRLKRLSKILEATIFRPYYPTSGLYRVVNDAAGLQLNFLYQAHGIKSFASLRSRALCLELFGDKLLVASFEDIIKSKQLADRQVDRAVLPTLRNAMHQAEIQKKQKNRRANLRALKLESERALIDLSRRRLALPVEQRCNFLRVRLPGGGSTL